MPPNSGKKRSLTRDRLLITFQEDSRGFLTTREVADQVSASRPTVQRRLQELTEDGELKHRKASNVNFYWLPGRVADTSDGVVSPDELVLDLDDSVRRRLEERANPKQDVNELAEKILVDEVLNENAFFEATKTLSFGVLIVMILYSLSIMYLEGVVSQILFYIGSGSMLIFFVALFLMPFASRLDPYVHKARQALSGLGSPDG